MNELVEMVVPCLSVKDEARPLIWRGWGGGYRRSVII